MALVRCRSCHEEIDAKYRMCPHCGARVPRRWEMPAKVVAIALALLVPAYYLDSVFDDEPVVVSPPTAEQQALQQEAERLHEEDLHRVCKVRDANRKVSNFQLVKVVRLPAGELCVHFSRTNAFGSAVGERWLVPLPDKGQPRRAKTCDGLPGPDRTAFLARDLTRCPG